MGRNYRRSNGHRPGDAVDAGVPEFANGSIAPDRCAARQPGWGVPGAFGLSRAVPASPKIRAIYGKLMP